MCVRTPGVAKRGDGSVCGNAKAAEYIHGRGIYIYGRQQRADCAAPYEPDVSSVKRLLTVCGKRPNSGCCSARVLRGDGSLRGAWTQPGQPLPTSTHDVLRNRSEFPFKFKNTKFRSSREFEGTGETSWVMLNVARDGLSLKRSCVQTGNEGNECRSDVGGARRSTTKPALGHGSQGAFETTRTALRGPSFTITLPDN